MTPPASLPSVGPPRRRAVATTLVLVAVSLSAWGARAEGAPAGVSAETPIEAEADRLEWDASGRQARLIGHARVTQAGRTLTAPEIRLDLEARRVHLPAGGTLGDSTAEVVARRLVLELDSPLVEAEEAQVTLRTGDRVSGRVAADRLTRTRPGHYSARGVRATLCDCTLERAPDWSVSAARAELEEGVGLWLFWPVVRIRDVPVLPLPVLYLPLADRKSGLLLPDLRYSGRNGFRVAEPLYLTLGPSWDLTLTAGVWTGGEGGVRGPDAALEARYHPVRGTWGNVTLSGLWDRNQPEDPARGSLTWRHRSRFGGGAFGTVGTGVAADLQLFSDAALLSQLALRLEGREPGLARSLARTWAGGEWLTGELAVRYLQDLRRPFTSRDGVMVPTPLLGGPDAPVVLQRLPMLHLGSARLVLPAGASAAFDLQASAWVPTGAGFEDSGVDGRVPGDPGWCAPDSPGCTDTGEGDGLAQPEEAGPALHAHLGGNLARPFHVGEVAVGRAALGLRLDGWHQPTVGGRAPASDGRALVVLDLEVATAVSRRFGGWSHRLRPWAGWRLVPKPWGAAPDLDLSAWDRPTAPGGLHQLSLGLDSRLGGPQGGQADVTLIQRVDLSTGGLDEASARTDLVWPGGRHRLTGLGAWRWDQGPTLAFGRLSSRWRWLTFGVSGIWIARQGSSLLMAGLDELFGVGALPPTPLASGDPVDQGDLSWSMSAPVADWLSVRGGLRLDPTGSREPQPSLGLNARSTCGCWALQVTTVWPPGQAVPEVVFGLRLGEL